MLDCPEAVRDRELHRSDFDFVTYAPPYAADIGPASSNEHFLVFEGGDGRLKAVWTRAFARKGKDQPPGHVNHTCFAKSPDGGKTWTEPKIIAGPKTPDDSTLMTSWAFPLVSKSGRIYVVWNQNKGVRGHILFHTGGMAGIHSDDDGETWSEPQEVEMPLSPYDDPTGEVPSEWIVWQMPMRDLTGGWFVGYSRWLNPKKSRPLPNPRCLGWTWLESVVEFMRFPNVDADPEARDLAVKYSAWGEDALRVPHWIDPLRTVAQEPSLVRLPDDRLFCVFRTNTGYIWYSLSADDGETWTNPQPLLRRDKGDPILQPVGCCPIYPLSDGRCALLHHNNRGWVEPEVTEKGEVEKTSHPRRPAYLALAEFRSDACQPLWFSESKQFLDNGGFTPTGERNEGIDIATYTSFTNQDGRDILWYPDRKCFLLGKSVTAEFLVDLKVPV